MAKSSPHPFPVLQVLAPGLLSSEVLIGLEKALVKLEIAYTKVEQRFLLGRELELFERNGLRQFCAERSHDLAILPAQFSADALQV
jgi:hypothetical protein